MKSNKSGFTIVELLIVIVIIGILAAITIVAYNGIQERSKFSREQADMTAVNKVIQLYYAANSQYPSTGGSGSWSGWSQLANFVPGVVPTFAGSLPQMPSDPDTNNSYLYTSNGTDYKLIRYSPATGLPTIQRTNNNLMDPARVNRAWGYWSAGALNW